MRDSLTPGEVASPSMPAPLDPLNPLTPLAQGAHAFLIYRLPRGASISEALDAIVQRLGSETPSAALPWPSAGTLNPGAPMTKQQAQRRVSPALGSETASRALDTGAQGLKGVAEPSSVSPATGQYAAWVRLVGTLSALRLRVGGSTGRDVSGEGRASTSADATSETEAGRPGMANEVVAAHGVVNLLHCEGVWTLETGLALAASEATRTNATNVPDHAHLSNIAGPTKHIGQANRADTADEGGNTDHANGRNKADNEANNETHPERHAASLDASAMMAYASGRWSIEKSARDLDSALDSAPDSASRGVDALRNNVPAVQGGRLVSGIVQDVVVWVALLSPSQDTQPRPATAQGTRKARTKQRGQDVLVERKPNRQHTSALRAQERERGQRVPEKDDTQRVHHAPGVPRTQDLQANSDQLRTGLGAGGPQAQRVSEPPQVRADTADMILARARANEAKAAHAVLDVQEVVNPWAAVVAASTQVAGGEAAASIAIPRNHASFDPNHGQGRNEASSVLHPSSSPPRHRDPEGHARTSAAGAGDARSSSSAGPTFAAVSHGPGFVPPPSSAASPVPKRGDYISHPKFGLCRIEGGRPSGGTRVKLENGVFKTLLLERLALDAPRTHHGRRIFPVKT